jgi:hypothetical protein
VCYVSLGRSDNAFGLLNRIPGVLWLLISREPIDLCSVKDVRHKDMGAF